MPAMAGQQHDGAVHAERVAAPATAIASPHTEIASRMISATCRSFPVSWATIVKLHERHASSNYLPPDTTYFATTNRKLSQRYPYNPEATRGCNDALYPATLTNAATSIGNGWNSLPAPRRNLSRIAATIHHEYEPHRTCWTGASKWRIIRRSAPGRTQQEKITWRSQPPEKHRPFTPLAVLAVQGSAA